MYCPQGHKKGTKVVDSRLVRDGRAVRRRRECIVCAVRFTTYEEREAAHLGVLKRDGTRQEYRRKKLSDGVAKALEKRPQERQIEQIVQDVERDIFLRAGRDGVVSSRDIGRIVLEHLKEIDEVAYLRFASVYKGFGSAASFRKELERL